MAYIDLKAAEKRMDEAMRNLETRFQGLRTGRASTSLLEPIHVESYGACMPLTSVATVSVLDARLLGVSVWDKANIKAVEKAIRESNLGLNPQTDGTLLRVPLPALDEERRKELVKTAHRYAEEQRVAVRNIRHDVNNAIKRNEKSKDLSEAEAGSLQKKVQELTDAHVERINALTKKKEAEILTV